MACEVARLFFLAINKIGMEESYDVYLSSPYWSKVIVISENAYEEFKKTPLKFDDGRAFNIEKSIQNEIDMAELDYSDLLF